MVGLKDQGKLRKLGISYYLGATRKTHKAFPHGAMRTPLLLSNQAQHTASSIWNEAEMRKAGQAGRTAGPPTGSPWAHLHLPTSLRPHSHHRDRNQTGVQHSRQHPSPHRVGPTRCPVPRLGQQVARRARRGVGAISSQRYPCPGTPASVARSSTHFLHRRGPPPRTQVSTKRGKRSRMAGIRRGRARAPGECSQDLPGDRHPIPKKAFSQGTTQLCPGRGAGRKSRGWEEVKYGVCDPGWPSRAEASRVRV